MSDVFYRVIRETPDTQIRLTVNEFREVEYISLREYYLDFNEEWQASNKGITMPLTIPVTQELFKGLVEILSLAETKGFLEENFKDTLDLLYGT